MASNKRHCCVPKCYNNASKNTSENKLSFHRLPKTDLLRKQWIIAIRRDPGKHFNVSTIYYC